jgi:hypothetical protein
MRDFSLRLLKTVLPTALVLAVCGYMLALGFGIYVTDSRYSGEQLRSTLAWRLPFTLAAWGSGIMFLYELFRSAWGKKPVEKKPEFVATRRNEVDAEQLLNQMLDAADTAELQRKSATLSRHQTRTSTSITDQTPMPRGEVLPIPDFDVPNPPPFR